MMGAERKRNEKLFYYSFNLEKRIRQDHPLRRVLGWVDFSFVRRAVKGCYGYNGHSSEDPIVIVKLMFLLFFEDIKSERELMRIVPERLDYLWFLGFDLEDKIPHHSILSKARARWGRGVFEELFVGVVAQCVAAGLVGGEKVHIDASLVEANASADSVMSGPPELIEQLKKVYAMEERKLEEVEEDPARRKYYRKKNRELMSRTDPEAAIVKQSRWDQSRPRYKNHRVVDDEKGVITAMETTAADREENRRMIPLTRQHERNTGRKVQTVVTDAQYGTQDNFAHCAAQGIRAHMSDLMAKRAQTGLFAEEAFDYDEQEDCYWCPAGQALRKQQHRKKRKVLIYKAKARVCNQCELKSYCTRSRTGRTLHRHILHEEVQKARAQSHSWQARQDRVRRKYLMEGSFADATNNHHFKRSRWRGLLPQQIQDYLIGVCQNVRILLRHPRHKPALSLAMLADHSQRHSFAAPLGTFWLFQNCSRRL
ncbi:MAG: IS1182 family transposase, partial [Acidobacteriota bacterium]